MSTDRIIRSVGTTGSIIIHTILFVVSFILPIFGVPLESVLLIVTTLVSLEAIYLAIFIQISVNRSQESLKEVERDIDEIQEDVGEIQEDMEEISGDVEELTEDMDKIGEHTALEKIEQDLQRLLRDIELLKQNK